MLDLSALTDDRRLAVGFEVTPERFHDAGGEQGAEFAKHGLNDCSFDDHTDQLTTHYGRVLAELDKQQRGIVLFHDTQAQTARMLPALLHDLKQQGYRVVHVAAR